MTGGANVTGPSTAEELAEDDGGFFGAFAEVAAGGVSRRKRNRQAYEQELEQQRAEAAEDEVIRKARAEEARKQIAAKVLARASPREVQQAVKKAKKEGQHRPAQAEGGKAQKVAVSAPQERRKKEK
ncbi:hypothetical protein TRSC58_03650 [Trypanosoma rangeli SC58]|uniref:Uncharacterized protein n=1 Tax=Trypanosoma rangeli SC58 TaxID=429131 RepID=A0A061J142_TRYRA|nr:hypothetical protein TRSC58_03650 [Trypanosoma rangeli SC58]